jgi:hypothetical protein
LCRFVEALEDPDDTSSIVIDDFPDEEPYFSGETSGEE